MILSYSKENVKLHRFPSKIIAGTKIHTIRADYADRWKKGIRIHHAIGLRTKYYNCFARGICLGTQAIEFTFLEKETLIVIDGYIPPLVINLARNDGFDNVPDFVNYFKEISIQTGEPVLTMKIIHFTNFKY